MFETCSHRASRTSAAALAAGLLLAACASTGDGSSAPGVAIDAARLSEHARVLSDDSFQGRGIATPADAAMMMQLGAEGVFVGSGIFKSGDPAVRAAAIVKATTFYDDPDVLARVSRGLGEPMVGINVEEIAEPHRLAQRGW